VHCWRFCIFPAGTTDRKVQLLKRFEGRLNIPPMIDPNRHLNVTHRLAANTVATSIFVVCLAIGIASLGGCSSPTDCGGGNYRGGCMPGAQMPYATSPPVGGPAGVVRGEPSAFADVDDKQCRSYGLLFGSHDYADCRIKLSAQHRGLDPNIGSTTPGR
jgi:hypothetical protein